MTTTHTTTLNIKKDALIKGLSLAVDLAENKKLSHAQHVTAFSMIAGKYLGLSKSDMTCLYYSALLHDIGATAVYLLLEHCQAGYDIIKQLPLDPIMADIIKYHHEFLDGSGPFRLKGDDIPYLSQVIHIGNMLEGAVVSEDKASFNLSDYEGKFNPEIINAYEKALPEICGYFENRKLDTCQFLQTLYTPPVEYCSIDHIKEFAKAFATVIDQRSPFTGSHSNGLTNIAIDLCDALEFNDHERNEIWIASLLHDLGKLGVKADVINKPGTLTSEERQHIESHAYYTELILGTIDGFEKIKRLASRHHEKLDGSGYPNRLSAKDLTKGERLIGVADIYQALKEERPYRKPLSNEEIWPIMDGMVADNKIDGDLVAILKTLYV